MQTTHNPHYRSCPAAGLAALIFVLAGASGPSLHAQVKEGTVELASAQPVDGPLGTTNGPAASLSYSSSVGAAETEAAASFIDVAGAGDAMQPPPRRRYGRPRYNDNSHNADGSNKYGFVVGAGLAAPIGNTHQYLTPSYDFQVGAGRNFSNKVALLLQFDYDHLGFQGSTLNNQQNLYNEGVPAGSSDAISGLDGSSHVWSFTLNPSYTFYSSNSLGAYVVAGGGFFHKTANFTVPAVGTYCDYIYGCYQYEANQTIDKYTSNAGGVNAGFGLTLKPSRFANERLFAEVRYVFVANPSRTGYTYANTTSNPPTTYSGNNFYPANSNRTTYIPIKVGIRF